jgi:hypothetical protein
MPFLVPRAVAYFLGAVIAGKLTILFLVGPAIWPDTEAYVSFADAILAHGKAFQPVNWTGGPAAPVFVFRLAGYPLVLAIGKLISSVHYALLTVFLQIFLNVLAVVLIAKVLERLSFTTTQMLLAIGFYVFSDSFLFDNSLLSDSIYSSLFNIVVFSLLGHLVGCWRLTPIGAAMLGLLWGFSTWTRDSGIFLTFLPIILFIAIARVAAGNALYRHGYFFAFAIVVFGMTSAYAGLNKYRTGEFFFSITGVENWLRPVFGMAQYKYADPFDGSDLVSQTVRGGMPDYQYPAQRAFIERLHRRCECTPAQLQSLVFDKYLTEVLHHPVAYLRVIWRNFHYFGLVGLVADPIATVNQFFEFGTSVQHQVAPGLSTRNLRELRQQFSWVTLSLMLLNALSTATGTVLFSLFPFGIPCLGAGTLARQEPIPRQLAIAGFLWFSFVSVSVVFSLVHYEARHALPILPAGCIGIVYAFTAARRLADRRLGFNKSSSFRDGPSGQTRPGMTGE